VVAGVGFEPTTFGL